jgi:hypothetical protein
VIVLSPEGLTSKGLSCGCSNLALNIPRPYVSSPMSNNRDAKFYEDLAATLRLELFFENHNMFILNPCLNQLVPRLSGRWSLG